MGLGHQDVQVRRQAALRDRQALSDVGRTLEKYARESSVLKCAVHALHRPQHAGRAPARQALLGEQMAARLRRHVAQQTVLLETRGKPPQQP
jgi:hypothetical protein